MLFRSKAPLRIGFGGGGTDVSPYSDEFGGAVLNASISLYAHTSIEEINEDKIILESLDQNEYEEFPLTSNLPLTDKLSLVKGVYNNMQLDFPFPPKGIKISTYVDAPAGSGLGTSSTLVVSLVGAFKEMLNLPLGNYDIAHYAFVIERLKLNFAGGKQDQYAATFGGFNFMEFYKDDKVIVNPLQINPSLINELEHNLVLYYTNHNRESAKIIKEQQKNVVDKNISSINAMHELKKQAIQIKEALLQGHLDHIGQILDEGFQHKKKVAQNISNSIIEKTYEIAINAGAIGGKISGAGGGGFLFFYCPKNTRYNVINKLLQFGGAVKDFHFTKKGFTSWQTKN